ncbi:MAG: UDP-N-acetylmuramoyl-tripeptide--D-alanyl-D-alanine ligase [Verrucomicrobiales bacterium]|nr:UDP-N-acetylmuramoyl-tripeptide--D-alanyl-D-alanine ligase [Verrucomicrobiales bacterium]
MSPVTLQQIADWCGGQLLQGDSAGLISTVSTDTRTLQPGALFVPLSGENFDAHEFIPAAAAAGAAAFLTAKALATPPPGGVIRVADPLRALQDLARCWRLAWDGRVIGLTGSNGKTSTKDFARAILARRFRVHATRGNLNNHIGLPLTLLAADAEHELAVCELGMNHPGEIAPLAFIAAPDAAIITNIGTAHIEFMGTREAIALEKGMLVEAVPAEGFAVLNADDPFTPSLARRCQGRVLQAGFANHADIRIVDARPEHSGSRFTLCLPDAAPMEIFLPVPGRHMVGNAALAAAAGFGFGLSAAEIAEGLASCAPPNSRLQRREVGGISFLDDSYNANPDSMAAALEVLKTLPCQGRRIAVLGRMGELGAHSDEAQRQLGIAVARQAIAVLCAVGEREAQLIAQGAAAESGPTEVHHFADATACASFLVGCATPEDLILVKGSRSSAMERVIDFFSQQSCFTGSTKP